MIIKGKYILSVDKYLVEFKEGESFYIAHFTGEKDFGILSLYGFNGHNKELQSRLPRPRKSATVYNSQGRWRVLKHLPKVERTFEREYHIVDWHGNDHYGTCYQTRMCYQRELIPPPCFELVLCDNIIRSPLLSASQGQSDEIKNIVNMFLEMFGECELLTEQFIPKTPVIEKHIPWTILPRGEYPWEKGKEQIKDILEAVPERQRGIISRRHEHLWSFQPAFKALGEEGFWGYVVYGFPDKNIYIFESNRLDNATYVFRGNWENASKLTKKEILANHYQDERIIHQSNWEEKVKDIFDE